MITRPNTRTNLRYIKISILEYRERMDDPATNATKHANAGRLGYQVIEDTVNEEDGKCIDSNCTTLVFDDGTPIPKGHVVGYSVVDADPPRPSWAPPVVGNDQKSK